MGFIRSEPQNIDFLIVDVMELLKCNSNFLIRWCNRSSKKYLAPGLQVNKRSYLSAKLIYNRFSNTYEQQVG